MHPIKRQKKICSVKKQLRETRFRGKNCEDVGHLDPPTTVRTLSRYQIESCVLVYGTSEINNFTVKEFGNFKSKLKP